MSGYTFSFGHIEYSGHRDGTPFTLVEAWREVRGVGWARIYRPDGSLLMRDAGSVERRSRVRQLVTRHDPRRTPLP